MDIVSEPKPEPHFYVAFVDILGFRRLVMENQMPRAGSLDHKRRAGWWHKGAISDIHNPIGRKFTLFHHCFERAVDKTPWSSEATIMVFSDSLFVGTTDAIGCMSFCETMTRYSIEEDVPVRVGVGYGTFVTHGFAFEATPRFKIVTTQFLGSAVIHAVDAEKAIKGTRIAVHPSAAVALMRDHREIDTKLIGLPASLASDAASHEWSLLSSASEMGGMSDPDFVDQENRLLNHLRAMMNSSPASEQHHYVDAIESLRAMVKLRDRWIPDGDED